MVPLQESNSEKNRINMSEAAHKELMRQAPEFMPLVKPRGAKIIKGKGVRPFYFLFLCIILWLFIFI